MVTNFVFGVWESTLLFGDASSETERTYPVCIGGNRAVPSEDCGLVSRNDENYHDVPNSQREQGHNICKSVACFGTSEMALVAWCGTLSVSAVSAAVVADTLTWSGSLPPGASATLTFPVQIIPARTSPYALVNEAWANVNIGIPRPLWALVLVDSLEYYLPAFSSAVIRPLNDVG